MMSSATRRGLLAALLLAAGACGSGTRSPGANPGSGGTSGAGGAPALDGAAVGETTPQVDAGPLPDTGAVSVPPDAAAHDGGRSDAPAANGGGDAGPGSGVVYFSNEGTLAGWSTARPQGGTIGKVMEVPSPTFKGATAILTEQTYVQPQGAHSETILAAAQRNGEDRYYGQAIYLPTDWNTIDENATFQQFSPEAPAGPWMLNWIQNDHIFIRVAGKHYDCGPIVKGAWTRVVVRFKTTNPGIFEYWVNGEKKQSVSDVDLTILDGSPSMRWSSGIYVTWWRTKPPGPQLTRQIFHDHLRVAASYELAEPANW
jgi:hypothetical protein